MMVEKNPGHTYFGKALKLVSSEIRSKASACYVAILR